MRAVNIFLTHPSPIFLLTFIGSTVAYRCSIPPTYLTFTEMLCIPTTMFIWVLQEYLIHRYLLHELENWYHNEHHKLPYYHVSIDGLGIVAPTSLVSSAIFATLLSNHIAATVAATYMASGLFYIWIHYLCHTRVRPGPILRHFKNHHIIHHMKGGRYSVTFPFFVKGK
jgi:hypothetical protein